jgi:hypothetical protein
MSSSDSTTHATVKCGDCAYFVRDGRCDWNKSADFKRPDRPFAHAPFWVWSDCYSTKSRFAKT